MVSKKSKRAKSQIDLINSGDKPHFFHSLTNSPTVSIETNPFILVAFDK